MRPVLKFAVLSSFLLLALVGCKREAEVVPETGQSAAPDAQPANAGLPAVGELKDVIETTDSYIVGISYPPVVNKYPGLARVVSEYTEAARAELMQAVSGLREKPTAPYELSLGFREVMRSSEVVAVAADGSLYTGGAHSQPLLARFVWLPRQQRMLTAQDLLASPEGWRSVADYVGEQLGAAAHTRAADEALESGDRERLLAVALRMIDEGTRPVPENFAQFEPVPAADGRIAALRFVFPPYQVGPYADGVQRVEVPAAVLKPLLAPDVSPLFVP